MSRMPAVAGKFYASNRPDLEKEIAACVKKKKEKINALGIVSPHAGYMYSGHVAGETISSIKPKSTYIIIGPNHTGSGMPFGLDTESSWKTPLGEVQIDRPLAENIIKNSRYIKEDSLSHSYEHSIEVQLPFLQYLQDDFNFVPIAVSQADKETCVNIGNELAMVLSELKKDVTIIASSDMTHYESHDSAKRKDTMTIDKILKLDISGFFKTVTERNISMCGYVPVAIMLQAAIKLGARDSKLIKYMTSGEISSDYSTVVGYAGLAIY